MRQPASGPVNGAYHATLPAGTTINSMNSWGSVLPLYGKPGDNVVCTWDESSFGPRGPLQLEGTIENTGQVLIYAWNWTGGPFGPTGSDLGIYVQVIPRG